MAVAMNGQNSGTIVFKGGTGKGSHHQYTGNVSSHG
jgi:hypothetical protein